MGDPAESLQEVIDVVRSPNMGQSAMSITYAHINNSSNRAYFLREGETVYDGMVSRITPDAIYFKQNVLDAKHEVHSREIVKVLNPAAGEVR